jgi:hypothetical protein
MNIKLLERVMKEIDAEPKAFDMDTYASVEPASPCGVTCCIAGTAVLLENPRAFLGAALNGGAPAANWIKRTARKVLQLTPDQATRLFQPYWWPEDFSRRYAGLRSRRARAKVTIERIRLFIQSRGEK